MIYMRYVLNKSITASIVILFNSSWIHYAQSQEVAIDPKQNEILTQPKVDVPNNAVNTELPKSLDNKDIPPLMSREEAKSYLSQNPQMLEETLSSLIKNNDAGTIAELLPIYQKYPNRDESLIDWGNAIISSSQGNIKKAIELYRKLNAALPNIKSVRFQLALALYQDKQFEAAKSELIKLRSNPDMTVNDVKTINQYINLLDKKDKWNLNLNLSYLHDENITNAPKAGTKIDGGVALTSPHQSGHGVGYNLSADKKYFGNSQFFTSVHSNINGSYYWDNKNYNDVTAGIGIGAGYQDSRREIEIYPKFSNRWYGLGSLGNESLHDYSKTKGIVFSYSDWLNTHWLYQNYSEYNETNYVKPYGINDGKYKLISNTLMYLPQQRRYFYTGLDYLDKKAPEDDMSFERTGIRLGWGETWNRGISTRLSLGYAQKDYDAKNRFTQIQGKDKEFNTNLSIWKRDLYLLGLTPRLSWQYTNVKSNDPFNEYSKNNVNLEFTKTF